MSVINSKKRHVTSVYFQSNREKQCFISSSSMNNLFGVQLIGVVSAIEYLITIQMVTEHFNTNNNSTNQL